MACAFCGKELAGSERFCPACGQRIPDATQEQPERVLFSFGPFGVVLCDVPFSIWRWHWRNCFVVELTDYRLRVLANTRFGFLTVPAWTRSRRMRLPLEIPYSSMVSAQLQRHPSPVSLMEVLDVRYLEDGAVLEKSIATNRDNAKRAFGIIHARLPQG